MYAWPIVLCPTMLTYKNVPTFIYIFRVPTYGHFTQMMIDRSHKIGCSMTTFYDNSLHVFYYLLACDYASTNIIGFPVYRILKEESECEKGQNPVFQGLCHPDEEIDPNLLQRY